MLNMQDSRFESIKKKYDEFWAMENHDRPLVAISCPKSGVHPDYIRYGELPDRWLNTEKIVHNQRASIESTAFYGEAFPRAIPDLGPDFLAGCFGVELEWGNDTSWSRHKYADCEFSEIPPFRFNPDSFYFVKMKEIMNALLDDSRGEYLVGQPDLHPGADALCAFRSSEQLCIDTIECPELVRQASLDFWRESEKAYSALFELTEARKQDGYTHWMYLWNRERWYTTSCDFICMIGPASFDELIAEELECELDFLPSTIFHLDGPDAIRHSEKLMKNPRINGIQWVPGAKYSSFTDWIPLLKNIQAAGKAIHLTVAPEEAIYLADNLRPEGLFLATSARDEYEAENLLKRISMK